MFIRLFLTVVVLMMASNVDAQVGNCQTFPFLTESIPEELPFAAQSYTTEAWRDLIRNAQKTLLFGAFYWTLSEGKNYPEYAGGKGAEIFELIKDAALNRSVKVQILQNRPDASMPDQDSAWLAGHGIEVVSINFSALNIPTISTGIFHTKVIVADNQDVCMLFPSLLFFLLLLLLLSSHITSFSFSFGFFFPLLFVIRCWLGKYGLEVFVTGQRSWCGVERMSRDGFGCNQDRGSFCIGSKDWSNP